MKHNRRKLLKLPHRSRNPPPVGSCFQHEPEECRKTCGHCHQGEGERFAPGPVHIAEGNVEAEPVKWIRSVYLIVIRKLWRMRFGPDRIRIDLRPSVWNSGCSLLSGYSTPCCFFHGAYADRICVALSDQFWARPLLMQEKQLSFRGVVHRSAAVVFIITPGLHIVVTIRNRGLRHHSFEQIPKASDLREAVRNSRPGNSHSHRRAISKGTILGGRLAMRRNGWERGSPWANTGAAMPKSVLEVATSVHFCEAVLAAAAMLIWHFPFGIVDPEI